MKIKNIATIIIILGLFAGVGYYLRQRISEDFGGNYKGASMAGVNTEGVRSPVDIDSGASNNSNAEQDDATINIPEMPDLNRPVVISVSESEDVVKEWKRRVNAVSKILKNDHGNMNGWIILGLTRTSMGDYEGAREIWAYMVKVWPKDIVAYNNLANLYSTDLKDYEKAEYWYKEGAERAQTNNSFFVEFANFYRYYTEEMGNVEGVYLLGLKKLPKDIVLLSSLARYYKDTGNTENARKYYKLTLVEAKLRGDSNLEAKIQETLDRL